MRQVSVSLETYPNSSRSLKIPQPFFLIRLCEGSAEMHIAKLLLVGWYCLCHRVRESKWVVYLDDWIAGIGTHTPVLNNDQKPLFLGSYVEIAWRRGKGGYQIQPSAPSNSSSTDSEYTAKSSMITTFTLALLAVSGNSRRDSVTMEVMTGFLRHWARTSLPI